MLTNREIAHFADQLPAGVKVVDMRNHDTKNIWSFVEKFYPNYSSCDEIAYNDELCKIVNGEYLEEGSGALRVYEELAETFKYTADQKNKTARGFIEVEAGLKLDSSNAEIYEKAIDGFLEFMEGGAQ